jgi:membrane-associated phospholipid phosphatase
MSNEPASWRKICLAALIGLGFLSALAYAGAPVPLEDALREVILRHASPPVMTMAQWVNYAGAWQFLLPAMLALFIAFPDMRRHWWLWAVVLPLGALVEGALKDLVGRARPESAAMGFPSGHVTAVAAFAVIFVYLIGRSRRGAPARAMAIAGGLLLVCAVGWARIVLRAHWPTDVLGGVALGVGVAAAAAWWHVTRLAAPDRPLPGGGTAPSARDVSTP